MVMPLIMTMMQKPRWHAMASFTSKDKPFVNGLTQNLKRYTYTYLRPECHSRRATAVRHHPAIP